MRMITGLLLVGAVMAQVSTANARTDVIRLPANNTFVTATSNEPDGTTRQVGVTRVLTEAGGPQYQLFYRVTNSFTGLDMEGGGLISTQEFHVTPTSASLDVDINDITLDFQLGELPEDGHISVEWVGTDDVQRTAGGSVSFSDNVQFLFTGMTVDTQADVTGTMFGTALFEPFGDIRVLSFAVIVITH